MTSVERSVRMCVVCLSTGALRVTGRDVDVRTDTSETVRLAVYKNRTVDVLILLLVLTTWLVYNTIL